MKKILTLALSAVLCLSCLKEGTDHYVSPDGFFVSKGACSSAVNSCYIPLRTIYAAPFLICTEGVTDLMYVHWSSDQNSTLHISPASAQFGITMWQQCYTGIRNANMGIEGVSGSPLPDDFRAPLVAEMRTLRAFYYYLLTSFFGDVPYYTDIIRSEADLQRIQRMARMPATDTRATLIAELQACVSDLPQRRSFDVGDQHVGAAFCYMLIAKLAMWNKDWDAARSALDRVVALYGSLDQYPLEDLLFSAKNTPESIFEIQHTYDAAGLKVTATVANYFMPKRADGDVYDGVPIPELGDQSLTYNAFRPNLYFSSSLMPKSSSDRRKSFTLAWDWNGKTFASVGTRPWMGRKFWCWNIYQNNDSNNYPVFRYADAVLMMAETLNELNEPERAISYLNQVKNRAGITPFTSFRNKQDLLEEIQRERARELIGEFQRKFDLVRWGIWYKQTYNYSNYSVIQENILPCHEYYPIPDAEVGLSGGALDNKEYDKYMRFND